MTLSKTLAEIRARLDAGEASLGDADTLWAALEEAEAQRQKFKSLYHAALRDHAGTGSQLAAALTRVKLLEGELEHAGRHRAADPRLPKN